MTIETMRHKLPLLAVGQAQKEYSHNEALTLIDNYLNLSVSDIANDPITLSPNANENIWLIGAEPAGIWAARANHIAIWTQNGWRYLLPIEHMQVYNEALGCRMVYQMGGWSAASLAIIPENGDMIDAQARESIAAIWDALRMFGWSR